MRARMRPRLVLCVLIFVAGCGLPASWQCTQGTCGEGEVCRALEDDFPRCHAVCSSSNGCPVGQACIEDICRPYAAVCTSHSDCRSGYFCAQPVGECLKYPHGSSTCTDGVVGAGETDLDCGGDCPPCQGGRACVSHHDCASGTCTDRVCTSRVVLEGGFSPSGLHRSSTYELRGSIGAWGAESASSSSILQPSP